MNLEPGKSYYAGTAKTHAIDVISLVDEPGRGMVAQCQYYFISEPHVRQPELYCPDGIYRLDRKPDPNWDVSGEYKKPPGAELGLKPQNGLFDKSGREIFPFVDARALARIYAKGETTPIIRFSYSEESIDGYVKFNVLPNEIVDEILKQPR